MDTDTPDSSSRFGALKRRIGRATTWVRTLIQTPLGSAITGGLVVVLIAHYAFGIG